MCLYDPIFPGTPTEAGKDTSMQEKNTFTVRVHKNWKTLGKDFTVLIMRIVKIMIGCCPALVDFG